MPKITISYINQSVETNCNNYIEQCEDAYMRSLKSVVDKIFSVDDRILVMLAGPSSSGKTTTARIISQLIKDRGRNATIVSLDDFYKEQTDYPVFEDGTPNFETIEALDINNIIKTLRTLVETGECSMPIFDFVNKKPIENGKFLKVGNNDVIIVEGLHALNPIITDPLKDENMLKLYVSVSTRIYNNEGLVEFTKRDIRFLRRLIRDYRFRNTSVEYTFYLWHGVRRGEDEYLFPFTKNADIKIDSIHPYELCLYKEKATQLLKQLSSESKYYEKAVDYINQLSLLCDLPIETIPENSLLHEFIG